jgi:hypothetical protein
MKGVKMFGTPLENSAIAHVGFGESALLMKSDAAPKPLLERLFT